MDDLISREAALNAIDCWHIDFNSMDGAKVQTDCWKTIKELPAVNAAPVVRCGDCKHRPEYDPPYSRNECDLVFPDDVCPMKCGDNWYSKRMPDDFFCAAGEGG